MKKTIEYDNNLSVKAELLDIKSYPPHFHDDFQILYVLEGELRLTLFYSQYILTPGSIHIIHPVDVHSMESMSERNLVLVLSFNTEFFLRIFPHFNTTIFITTIEGNYFSQIDTLRDQIFSIVSEYYYKGAGYASRLNNVAVSLFNTLMKNFRGFVIDETDKKFSHKTSNDYIQTDRISRIIQYVYENYPYKISLTEMAESEQMSSYYLSHIFHKLVGLNFRDFLSMVRVEMSLPSILSTSKSISQISQDMGFSDAKYYVSTFHNYLGCHPKEYRKKYCDSIYGIKFPEYRDIPFPNLKTVIGKYTQMPVFKDSIPVDTILNIDFKATPICKCNLPDKKMFVLDNLLKILSAEAVSISINDLSKLYKDVIPQMSAVKLLSEFASDPLSFSFPSFNIIDSEKSANGFFTPNGLKKPMCYLYEMMKRVPKDIISYGPTHIAFRGNTDEAIILFNPNKTNATIDIVAKKLSSNCKLTRYKLIAEGSCVNYLAQLNFPSTLDQDDFENINAMSRPDIEFELLPLLDQYYTSVELAPNDIILLHFKHIV